MSKREASHKLKVVIPKADIIANRDAVNMLLRIFGYPTLYSTAALESQIYRERQARDKRELEGRAQAG